MRSENRRFRIVTTSHEPFEFVASSVDSNGTASNLARVTLLNVEIETFEDNVLGPDKPHLINLSTRQNESQFYGDYEKCVSHVCDSSEKLDLINYLAGSDDTGARALYEQTLKWHSNGTELAGFELDYGSVPESDGIKRFDIEVMIDGSGRVLDRLIVVILHPQTKQRFDTWYDTEITDMGWLQELPPLYKRFQFTEEGIISPELVPDDPEPSNCSPQRWGDVGDSNTYYHPDGYYKMRSKKTPNDHGHQAIYNGFAGVIRSGVSAGSADRKAAFPENFNPFLHVDADVTPFIWAAQLDGNPVEANGTTMTAPMLHEGAYLNRYLEVRPPIANSKPELNPNTCAP